MGDTLFDIAGPSRGRPVSKIGGRVRTALNAATHLEPADQALRYLAERISTDIDRTSDVRELAVLSKALREILAELAMTPQARARLGTPAVKEDDPIDSLRADAATLRDLRIVSRGTS